MINMDDIHSGAKVRLVADGTGVRWMSDGMKKYLGTVQTVRATRFSDHAFTTVESDGYIWPPEAIDYIVYSDEPEIQSATEAELMSFLGL